MGCGASHDATAHDEPEHQPVAPAPHADEASEFRLEEEPSTTAAIAADAKRNTRAAVHHHPTNKIPPGALSSSASPEASLATSTAPELNRSTSPQRASLNRSTSPQRTSLNRSTSPQRHVAASPMCGVASNKAQAVSPSRLALMYDPQAHVADDVARQAKAQQPASPASRQASPARRDAGRVSRPTSPARGQRPTSPQMYVSAPIVDFTAVTPVARPPSPPRNGGGALTTPAAEERSMALSGSSRPPPTRCETMAVFDRDA